MSTDELTPEVESVQVTETMEVEVSEERPKPDGTGYVPITHTSKED